MTRIPRTNCAKGVRNLEVSGNGVDLREMGNGKWELCYVFDL
jgi:hypothetical protein